jgi:hypothetical protein
MQKRVSTRAEHISTCHLTLLRRSGDRSHLGGGVLAGPDQVRLTVRVHVSSYHTCTSHRRRPPFPSRLHQRRRVSPTCLSASRSRRHTHARPAARPISGRRSAATLDDRHDALAPSRCARLGALAPSRGARLGALAPSRGARLGALAPSRGARLGALAPSQCARHANVARQRRRGTRIDARPTV